jgi:hypothetical protein
MDSIRNGEQLLYFQQGNMHSVGFALSFAERPTRPFACRITGGCGEMTAADAVGMRNVERALCGFTKGKRARRHFAGFGIFGGTRMLSVHDTSVIVPGITEIFPNVLKHCPGTEILGIVAGFQHMIRDSQTAGLADKLILTRTPNHVTVVHPDPRSVLFLQADPNNEEVWDDEYKETFACFRQLHTKGWQTLNLVYNGGSVTEREIKLWAEWGNIEPGKWNMLLINDSGRKCTQYAQDKGWLREHPCVRVAENDVNAINDQLWELGALVEEAQVVGPRNVVPFKRRA